ncbi:glycerol-3-phosphate dehydrogenase/oxidase [Ensifer soli]|uniref:glycerol-3-phosphate dehydrogenase/oxidase n=1 Tax=Ciceribacter sp. sgz301302 TaxID=3342379 RepID=UPI0035B9E504
MTDAVADYDVVILGAGVNGAGLFRELTLQGLACLIVDKGDYGSGTSAAPSRLIHGGIKYLETGEFRLVAQSTLERNLLLRNAPHCVEPLATFIPSFSLMKGVTASLRTLFGSTTAPRSRGAILIKIGLALYDFYGSRQRVMPKHRFFFRRQAMKEIPVITPKIVAGGIYYDAKICRPERLVYELVADGIAAEPRSKALNNATLEHRDGGVLTFRAADGGLHRARPTVVVNGAGPWIDQANAALGVETRLIGGTKGSHIVIDHPELIKALDGRMIYFEADDGRICLVYDHLGLALVGSTDIKAANPDSVRIEDDEIDYFIGALAALLPGLSFSRDSIVYAYSGIRPLPASDAANPGLISRDHSAPVIEPSGDRPFPILSLVGGKWTTFRGFAEEVCDTLLTRLGRARRLSTRDLAIGGGRAYPAEGEAKRRWIAERARASGLAEAKVADLLFRFGTTADRVIAHIAATGGDRPLAHVRGVSAGEIDYIARNEQVVHLADIVLRRTTLAIEGLLTTEGLAELADIAAGALNWSAERRAEELAAVTARLTTVNRMRL